MSQSEIQNALDRYIAQRERMESGDAPYSSMADLFTEDGVFVDIVAGRIEGRENIRKLLADTTDPLGFAFPMDAWACSGDWAFVKWRQVLPNRRPDGSIYEQSGISTLRYGREGLWQYQEDLMNMAHVMEDIAASGWVPPEGYEMPPEQPNRDFGLTPRSVG